MAVQALQGKHNGCLIGWITDSAIYDNAGQWTLFHRNLTGGSFLGDIINVQLLSAYIWFAGCFVMLQYLAS